MARQKSERSRFVLMDCEDLTTLYNAMHRHFTGHVTNEDREKRIQFLKVHFAQFPAMRKDAEDWEIRALFITNSDRKRKEAYRKARLERDAARRQRFLESRNRNTEAA